MKNSPISHDLGCNAHALVPHTPETIHKAQLTVIRKSKDRADAAMLLDMIGILPGHR